MKPNDALAGESAPGGSPHKSASKKLFTAFLAVLTVFVLLFFARPLYLPDSFLIRQIKRRIEAATGLRLDVSGGHIHLLKAMTFRSIVLKDSAGDLSVTADELTLRYRLLALLEKRLEILELSVKKPHVSLLSRTSEQATPGAEALAPPAESAKPALELPLTIDINQLTIRDASLRLVRISPQDTLQFAASGWQLMADHLHLKSSRDYHAEVKVEQNDSARFEFRRNHLKFDLAAATQLRAAGRLHPDSSHFALELGLNPEFSARSGAAPVHRIGVPKIALTGRGSLWSRRDLRLEQFELVLDSLAILKADAQIRDIFNEKRFAASIVKGEIAFQPCWRLAREILRLQDGESPMLSWQLAGRFEMSESALAGSLARGARDLQATLRWKLEDVAFYEPNSGLSLNGLEANSFIQCHLLPKDSLFLDSGIDLHVKSFSPGRSADARTTLAALDLGISASISHDWLDPYLQLVWQAQGPWDARQEGSFVLRADRLKPFDPLLSPGLFVEGGGSLNDLPLHEIFPELLAGSLSTAVDLKAADLDEVYIKLGAYSSDLSLLLPQQTLSIPPLMLTTTARGALSLKSGSLGLYHGVVSVPPYADVNFSEGTLSPESLKIADAQLKLQLNEILPVIAPLLPENLRDAMLSGELAWSGSACGWVDSTRFVLEQKSKITGSPLSLSLPKWGIRGDTLSLSGVLRGDLRKLTCTAELNAGTLAWADLRTEPYHSLAGGFTAELQDLQKLEDASFWVEAPELGLACQGYGNADWSGQFPTGEVETHIEFAAADSVRWLEDLALSGRGSADVMASFAPDSTVGLQGRLLADSLSLRLAGILSAESVALDLPLGEKLKLDPAGLIALSPAPDPMELQDPVLFAALDHQFFLRAANGFLRLGRLSAGSYEAQNLTASLSPLAGRLLIPRFTAGAYEGVIAGSGAIEISALIPDSVRFEVQFDAQKLNSTKLPGVKKTSSSEAAEITAFGRFRGQGLDPRRHFQLEGGLDITRIGGRVADNLLKFLDPEETDPSIQTYRGYIRRGWGVKVFSFEIKDDFVYTAITPSKPPLTQPDMFLISQLIGLGNSITFGRLPLQFFLNRPAPSAP